MDQGSLDWSWSSSWWWWFWWCLWWWSWWCFWWGSWWGSWWCFCTWRVDPSMTIRLKGRNCYDHTRVALLIRLSLFSWWSYHHYSQADLIIIILTPKPLIISHILHNHPVGFIRTWLSSRQRWGGGVGGQAGQEDGYLWKNDNGSMFWLLWPVSWDFANCVTYSGRQVSILLKQPLTDLLWSNRTFKVQFGLKHLTNCLLRGATFIFHTTSAELWWWWWRLQRWWRW